MTSVSPMIGRFWDRAEVAAQRARSALSWVRRDTGYPSPPGLTSPTLKHSADSIIADARATATAVGKRFRTALRP